MNIGNCDAFRVLIREAEVPTVLTNASLAVGSLCFVTSFYGLVTRSSYLIQRPVDMSLRVVCRDLALSVVGAATGLLMMCITEDDQSYLRHRNICSLIC